MTPQLRTKILQAHANGSLFGLFIDVQNFYCTTQSARDAFTHIKSVSGQLEALGAQNIWAVWPTASKSRAPEKGTPAEFNLYGKDAFAIAQPSASSIIYTKRSQNLRENKAFRKDFTKHDAPVFLIGGATSDLCIPATIVGIVEEFETAHAIVLDEAITPKPQSGTNYAGTIKKRCDYDDERERIHSAAINDVIETLSLAA